MSSFPGTGITFDVLGGLGGLDRTLSDALSRIKSFAAEASRISASVNVGVNTPGGRGGGTGGSSAGGLGGGAILRGLNAEANDLFANRGFVPGGGSGQNGKPSTSERADLAIRRALYTVTLVEGALASGSVVVKALGAAADLMNGDSKAATKKMADAGDALKRMKGPLGAVFRLTSELMDDFLIPGKSVAQIEADAKKIDEKTDRLAARNQAARGVNEGFAAVSRSEADAAAKEGKTASGQELVDVRRQIEQFQKTRQQNQFRGVDNDAADKALAALRRRELKLQSDAARESEVLETEHQNKLAAIREQGAIDQAKAAGFTEGVGREELLAKQRQQDREELLALNRASSAKDQRKAFATLEAGRAGREQELGAFDADEARKQGERRDRSGEAAADFARSAGEAALRREREREGVAGEVRAAQFEGRQVELQSRGLNDRARLEAIQRRAAEDLRTAENPELRAAIEGRQESELKALLRDLNRPTRGEVVADPTRTAFGRGGTGVGDNGAFGREIDKTLKGDIKRLLEQIRDKDTTARTS
jgi:hypothetical protein